MLNFTSSKISTEVIARYVDIFAKYIGKNTEKFVYIRKERLENEAFPVLMTTFCPTAVNTPLRFFLFSPPFSLPNTTVSPTKFL
jgi:hypothetical protein